MVITATELKANMGHYIETVADSAQGIYITKNGRLAAKLSSVAQDKQSLLDSLVGVTADNPVGLEEARKDRLTRQ